MSSDLERWRESLNSIVRENILAAFPPRLKQAGKLAWQKHMGDAWLRLWPSGEFEADYVGTVPDIEAKNAQLFSFDLAHQPFRFIGLPKELVGTRGIPNRKTLVGLNGANEWVPSAYAGIRKLLSWTKLGKGLPHGLLFATRPFELPELYLLAPNPFSKAAQADFDAVVRAVIGCRLKEKTPYMDSQGVLQIPDGKAQAKQVIAVSSWKTEYSSWVAAVMRKPEPDSSRYARLNRLVNTVIALPQKPRYFILPEMAMPYRWFMRIARQLQRQGISLITGMEYQHTGKTVQHQVWAALTHDGLGYPAMMIYQQDKLRSALHEGEELDRLAGLKLVPQKTWQKPRVIQHGDFRFALLVCSELTNIGHRAALRGKVDALFVPEWNQDIETFNALVESAALDIHAYIIQCNDRQYGDSRIRAPYKDSWKRDVLRVKGGIHDYCVTGEIDIQALRQFQSSHRSPSGPFKPVPDGFAPAHARKTLPKGGES